MNNLQMGVVLQHLCRAVGRHDDELGDEQLLERFAWQREESAFAALLRRHGPMVLSVCRGILRQASDVEDAFQATFLVLAQKAASIRRGESVGGWLYEVAYRVALKAQAGTARRRQFERRTPAMTQADPLDDMTVRELRRALHEELRQLPEKYRTPLVLCYLQGKTQEEAARQLGWPRRRVKDRLQRGREQLRRRLSKRGLAPVAALTTTLFAADGVSAALAGATVGLAMKTDSAAPAVATLAQAGYAALSGSKAKIAALILLVASLLSGTGLWWSAKPQAAVVPPAEPPAAKANDKPAAAPPKGEAAKTVEIQGRVLDPDGKPKAGAKLLLLGKEKATALGATAEDGRFSVAVPKEAKDVILVVRSSDAGMDYLELRQLRPGKPVELRLVKDNVIRGRIVNTEGKPVAGVRLDLRGIIDNTDKTLDRFLIGRKKRASASGRLFGARPLWNKAAVLRAAVTDADGRFAVHGIGADRLIYLRMSDAGIAEEELWIVNRPGFDPKPYNLEYLGVVGGPPRRSRFDPRELGMLFGPDLSIVAEAEKPIRGVVKDSDSGTGRPNVVVYLSSPGNAPIPVPLQAKTDADGSYEIHGCRKAKSYTLEVVSDARTGYAASQLRIADTVGYEPLLADIPIKKGTIVTGKVIDRASGKAVPGFAETAILRDNPFAKVYPRSNASALGQGNRVNTATDGSFRIVTVPGQVLLMGGYYTPSTEQFDYIEFGKYRPPVADPEYPQYFAKLRASRRREAVGYLAYSGAIGLIQGNFCKVLDIKPGMAKVHQDILLERASFLEAKIQDAEGRPVEGVWATDFASDIFVGPLWIERSTCPVYGLEQRKPRLLIFYEPKKKIIGSRKLQGDEKAPMVIELAAMGAIKGQLLDADGKPLAGIEVDVAYHESEANKIHPVIHKAKEIITDANGTFAFEDVIPGLDFQLLLRRGTHRFQREAKPKEAIIAVKPGETHDVGAIKLKASTEKPEK